MKVETDIKIRDSSLELLKSIMGTLVEDTANAIKFIAKEDVPVRSGALQRDIQIISLDKSELTAEVGVTLPYGKYVELGTVKMDAQEYLVPATIETLENIESGQQP